MNPTIPPGWRRLRDDEVIKAGDTWQHNEFRVEPRLCYGEIGHQASEYISFSFFTPALAPAQEKEWLNSWD